MIRIYKARERGNHETHVISTEYVIIDLKIHSASDVRVGCGLRNAFVLHSCRMLMKTEGSVIPSACNNAIMPNYIKLT